ncbi:uncharacterized protein BO97DRAFT_388960 [Aspergillus homomorphus CBS 101889]|uniref:Rhodopsin domain-containing protein n=1 Tax=Aspergillus homomorphus (strain CBS 101889) TaxID=1450537 RepID=A0A395HZ23_ASPHC|nr:hypothetical protein BO97DRAFT_388960 [Aspergillus homomorphus CBS 101889]RAL13171.1 hypothetical protein BO97DRAFT_388960 [Aspergillus homomorphus CBS 101889]
MSAQSSSYPAGWLEVDHGSRVMAAVSFILVFTTILLALRLYARSLTSASRGWDEFLLVPSYLCLLGLLVCLYLDVIKGGLGRHGAAVEQEDPQKLMTFLELLYVLDWFYVPSNAMSRISVVALYLRFFTQPLYRAACWGVIAFLLGNMIATIIAAQVECFPLQFTWDKTIRGGHCFNLILWYKLTNLPTVISDVMVMALPVPTVWGLQASFSCKAGIATVFLTGSMYVKRPPSLRKDLPD